MTSSLVDCQSNEILCISLIIHCKNYLVNLAILVIQVAIAMLFLLKM